jgi:hypothetical protein
MTILRPFLFLAAAELALLGYAYWSAIADPIVRQAQVELPDWPTGSESLRVVLMSAERH